MKTSMLKNNKTIVASICATALLTSSFVVASSRYFHDKEIDTLVAKCEEQHGTYDVTMTDALTNSYSFQCLPND